jgi:serine/threonine protein phosphatase PrpC
MQGWRDTMEDADLVRVELPGNVNGACFAIFDGHGGDFVAKQVYEQHKNSVLSFSLPIRKNSMMDCHLASNA